MVFFEGNREPGADSIVTALHPGEGKLPLDDALLYAAQHLGLEVNLCNDRGGRPVTPRR